MILAGFVMLMLLHLIFVFCGFYGGDDINYARYAAAAARGINFSTAADQFQLRRVTVYSTAAFYKLFGMTAFTSSLSSFFSFIGCGIILHKILKEANLKIYLLSMALFFFSHSIVFYAHRLLADPAVCFASFWMYYSYRCYYVKEQHDFRYACYFTTAFLIAVMAKETVLIIIPLFAVLFAKDLIQKKRILFWKYAAPLSTFAILLYLLYFKITTGDFLYRYHVLLSKSYFTDCSFDQLPFYYTLQRIGYELWKAMLLNGDLLIYLPAVAAFMYRKKIGLLTPDALAFIILTFCANFMSISFTRYVPLCQDPRHFIFLIPFAALCGGPVLYHYFNEPKRFILLPLLMLAATAFIFMMHGGNTKYLYLLFTLLLVLVYLISKPFIKYSSVACIAACISIFSFNYLVDFIRPPYPFYGDQKKIIASFAASNPHATVFSADEVSGELNEFFLKFSTGYITFKPLVAAKADQTGRVYLMLNAILNPAIKTKTDSLLNTPAGQQVKTIEQQNNIYLYEVNNNFLQKLTEGN